VGFGNYQIGICLEFGSWKLEFLNNETLLKKNSTATTKTPGANPHDLDLEQ
jgi:hypothetical protein